MNGETYLLYENGGGLAGNKLADRHPDGLHVYLKMVGLLTTLGGSAYGFINQMIKMLLLTTTKFYYMNSQ